MSWGLQDMKLSQVIINTPARWDYWSQWQSLGVWGAPHPTGQHLSSPACTTHLPAGRLPLFVYMDASLFPNKSTHKSIGHLLFLHQKLKENLHNHCQKLPKREEKASMLSAGLTLLSNVLMLNQSNWVWAQQKSMRSLSSPTSNTHTHTLINLPKRFSCHPLCTKISNVCIQFLHKVLQYLPFDSIRRMLRRPT